MNKEERQQRRDYIEEVFAIFAALEQAGHDLYEASWKGAEHLAGQSYPRHRTDLPWNWFNYRQGNEPFDTPAIVHHDKAWGSFGKFRVLDKIEGTELGYDCEWSGPRALIFEQVSTGRCFRITGKNTSHVGENWDYPTIAEVNGTVKALMVWEPVK